MRDKRERWALPNTILEIFSLMGEKRYPSRQAWKK
jgi:hypothetical protein